MIEQLGSERKLVALVATGDPGARQQIVATLEAGKMDAIPAASVSEALRILDERGPTVSILITATGSDPSGLDDVRRRWPHVTLVRLDGWSVEEV